MNTVRVSKSAWRKPGMLMMIILLGLIALTQGKAQEVQVTATGTLTGGWDHMGVFFHGPEAKALGGKPFTLVFSFDESRGKTTVTNGCAGTFGGSGTPSAGKAVLTLGDVSYTFGGEGKYSNAGIFRDCSGRQMRIFVTEKSGSFFGNAPVVNLELSPENPRSPIPQSREWKSAATVTTKLNWRNSCFVILKGGGGADVQGCFNVQKVVISAGKTGQ